MEFLHKLIVTSLGLGYSPKAPGTVGALGGCFIAVLLGKYATYPNALLTFLILLFFVLGVYSSNKVEQEWGKDPSKIVIDEVVGMWISLLLLPSGWWYTALAFVLFRLLDIYKPLFIRRMEKLKGGWGVMMDDVLAGIYANVIIQLLGAIIININGR
jgi:phosphatidylglycerophosphatase A